MTGAAWFLTPSVASARAIAIAVGDPCKQVGRERTVNGVTFVCRKVGGKSIWRRKKAPTVVEAVTVRVLDSAQLALGSSVVVEVPLGNGTSTGVVVSRTTDGLSALRVNCSHQGFPVSRVEKVLECELHGSQFDPFTGAPLRGPASRPLVRYDVSEADGSISVTVKPN